MNRSYYSHITGITNSFECVSEVDEWEEASDRIYMAIDTDYNYIAVSSQIESMKQT